MRLHANPDHPDYQLNAYHCEIYFNGTKQELVFALDDEAQWIEAFVTDRAGQIVIENDKPKIARRYGEVRVIEHPDYPLDRGKRVGRER